MTTIEDIRARWLAIQTPVVMGLKMPPMASMIDFDDNADADIEFLLAEIERLHAVVEAARVFVHPTWNVLSSLKQQQAEEDAARERLRDAFAKLDTAGQRGAG